MHRWDLYSLPNSSSGSPYWLVGILTWLFHSHQNLKTNTFTKPPPFLDFSKYFSTDAFIHSMGWHSKCIPFLSFSGLGTSHPYSPTPNQWPGLSVPVLLYGSQLPFPKLLSMILKHVLIRLQVLYFDIQGPSQADFKSLSHTHPHLKSFYMSQTYLELPLTLCSNSDPGMVCLFESHAVSSKLQLKAHLPWTTPVNSVCLLFHTSIWNS